MPNFLPFKQYAISLIDRMVDQHRLRGPFLDAGCGRGDVALHLATRYGWEGVAADFSEEAVVHARKALATKPGVRVVAGPLDAIEGRFSTVVLCTVIEHVADDRALLRHLRSCCGTNDGAGHLIISMPTDPEREWRWDDDFYGHYRRYTRADVERLLGESGFRLIAYWDYTFPVFWAMRRAYTAILRPRRPVAAIKEQSSAASALQSAWDLGLVTTVVEKLPIWPLVFGLQWRFRGGSRGFEAIALAETV